MASLITLLLSLLFVYCAHDTQASQIAMFQNCKNRKMNSSSIIEVVVTSGIECARLCRQTKSCKSTNFIHGENMCQLMDENADCGQLPVDGHTDVFRMIYPVRDGCPYNATENPCKFNQPFNETSCQCLCGRGFSGVNCENPPRDCTDMDMNDHADIYLPDSNEKHNVRCNKALQMWILDFRKNAKLSSHVQDGWNEFKVGFNKYGFDDFWIGNDFVNNITTSEYSYVLEMSIRYNSSKLYQSKYYEFVMDNEASNYTVRFASDFNSLGHDGIFSNNTQLHAIDYNSNNCTDTHGSTWWYNEMCPFSSPFTGNYSMGGAFNPILKWNMFLKRI